MFILQKLAWGQVLISQTPSPVGAVKKDDLWISTEGMSHLLGLDKYNSERVLVICGYNNVVNSTALRTQLV